MQADQRARVEQLGQPDLGFARVDGARAWAARPALRGRGREGGIGVVRIGHCGQRLGNGCHGNS